MRRTWPLLVLLGLSAPALALAPMEWFNSLVAGGEDAGYRDGAFSQARFDHPAGLAFDATGERLFVADCLNHRIRLVLLDEQNRVETLAGTGTPGRQDGPLAQASFNRPSLLAVLPDGKLVVYEAENQDLRLLDLQAGSVTTLGVAEDGKSPAGPLGFVRDMAYVAKTGSLFLSEPLNGTLQKLDLSTQRFSTVLSKDARVPAPSVLCADQDRLYLSDRDRPDLYEVQTGDTKGQDLLKPVGKGDHLLAMTASNGVLYGLQAGNKPLARLLPDYRPIPIPSAWGFFNEDLGDSIAPLVRVDPSQFPGFAASPREPGKLYLASPRSGAEQIVSLKDRAFEEYWKARTESGADGSHLTDFDYPTAKPPKTFRFLLVGSSRLVTAPVVDPQGGQPGHDLNPDTQSRQSLRMDTFPKQLEFQLNVLAALDGLDTHFEVLTLAHPGRSSAFFAPHEVPALAQKYQVDAVLLYETAWMEEAYAEYYQKRLTPEGIPEHSLDLEFILQSSADRVPPGAPADLVQREQKKGIVQKNGSNLSLPGFDSLLRQGDAQVREDLIEMIGRPLRVLSKKLQGVTLSKGRSPGLYLLYGPSRDTGAALQDDYESFWKELCRKNGFPLGDLAEAFNGMKAGFGPTEEICCHRHYTAYGSRLFAQLTVHWLATQPWMPRGFKIRPGIFGPDGTLGVMDSYLSHVAGGDDPGFRDGPYAQARFDQPAGLALDGEEKRLFVADRANRRVRVVRLDENDRVETLAGSGKAGSTDGPAALASFEEPFALAWVPGDRLVVYDRGSRKLRAIDLATGTVSTLGWEGPEHQKVRGPAQIVSALAYDPQGNALYLSESDGQALERFDLGTESFQTVLSADVRVPHPRALCWGAGHLYVADSQLPTVYRMAPVTTSSGTTVTLEEAGRGQNITALAFSDGTLYALQGTTPVLARLGPSGALPVSLASPFGFTLDDTNPGYEPLLRSDPNGPVGFTAGPLSPRKFFISPPLPGLNSILAVKDRRVEDRWTAASVADPSVPFPDFDYPRVKSRGTYRILVVGDSRTVFGAPVDPQWRDHPISEDDASHRSPRLLSFPKQLEFLLNSEGALGGSSQHFEVLTLGRPGWSTPFFLNDQVPAIARDYNVDLVIVFAAPQELEGFVYYYWNPLTKEGIASHKEDPEYFLKPYSQKIPPGAPQRLYRRCKEKGWVRVNSPTQLGFDAFGSLLSRRDPEVRDALLEMTGKPFQLLAKKLEGLGKTGKAGPGYLLLYAPGRDTGGARQEDHELFWRDLAAQYHWPFLDLSDPYNALQPAFSPVDEACCHSHYLAYGHALIARLLGYYLADQGWLNPGRTSGADRTSK